MFVPGWGQNRDTALGWPENSYSPAMADGRDVSVPGGDPADPVRLRVLGGPNAHFSWPAVEPVVLAALGRHAAPALARPGAAGSPARCRYLARLAACLTRAVAAAAG